MRSKRQNYGPLFLQCFQGGTEKFVYWTFWPSTIITYRAARDIYTSFSSDAQLLEILTQTKIVATEEIVFPTLAALLGYEIEESPCSYQYVRWGAHITPIEVDAARHMLNAYWVHTVPRHYDNPTRKYMREKFNGYQPYLNSNLLNKSTYPPRVNLLPSDLSIIHQAKGVEGWLEDEEAELLIATASRTRQTARDEEATIVEIGSYCGKSTIVLGLALKAHKIRASIYAIDPFDGVVGAYDQGRRQVGTTFETFINNIHSWGLTEIVKPIKSHSFKIHWDKPIDLLFIDALHDYPNVAGDFFHFAKWVRPDGLIALHDYATYYPGVHTFVDELLASGEYHLLEASQKFGRFGESSVWKTAPL